MLLDYLDKVREKPRQARKRFAFLTSVGVTAVIAVAWAFTLPARFASLNVSGDALVGSAGMQEFNSDFGESSEGLQGVIDIGQDLQGVVSPEMQKELQAEGFLQGGDTTGVVDEAVGMDAGIGAVSGGQGSTTPRVIIIATSSAAENATSTSR